MIRFCAKERPGLAPLPDRGDDMTDLKVVSPGEWAAARKELRAKEIEEAGARADLNAARRAMPAVKVDQEYVLDGPDGEVSLLEVFEGRRQLVVYHFMFDPSWDQGCRFCSHVIDNVGNLAHLRALGTTFAVVSRAQLPKIQAFRARMGWSVPWYSSFGSDFNEDFSATADGSERGGFSVFLRDGGSVYRTYEAFDDAVDLHLLDSSYIDLAPLGIAADQAAQPWPLHHDKYA
jgi:predicted dithiol-disulfide oxidoreductase (DUF899 family)